LQAGIRESSLQLAALQSQVHADTLAKIAGLQHQRDSLAEQLRQAEDALSKQVLHAPVAGQVKDLAVHTVGGVVQAAQQLMLIVPAAQPLEVEAWLPNRDIGFIHEGDRVVIKVHTFPFTKYGTLSARVLEIADDAMAEDQPGNARNPLHYRMLLQLEQSHLVVGERLVPLLPGMQVTAEVITGQRRIIEFFLSPLQQRVQEGLRER
jgi:hemolysin D